MLANSFSADVNRLSRMWKTHGIGRYFIQFIRLRKNAPRVHRSTTHEITRPFRVGDAVLIRIFGERSIVLGTWTGYAKDEDDAVTQAIQAHEIEVLDEDGELLDRYRRDDEPETVHAA